MSASISVYWAIGTRHYALKGHQTPDGWAMPFTIRYARMYNGTLRKGITPRPDHPHTFRFASLDAARLHMAQGDIIDRVTIAVDREENATPLT